MQVEQIALTAVPVVAAGVAGGVAVVRRPGDRVTSGLQHFAAGVVIAAAALELLPEVVRQSGLVSVVGFALGIGVMFAMRAVTSRLEGRAEQRQCGQEVRSVELDEGLLVLPDLDDLPTVIHGTGCENQTLWQGGQLAHCVGKAPEVTLRSTRKACQSHEGHPPILLCAEPWGNPVTPHL